MSLPEPIRQSIRSAITRCGKPLYAENPDPYVNPVEAKIIQVVNSCLLQAREACVSHYYRKQTNKAFILASDTKEIITTIFEKHLWVKCDYVSHGKAESGQPEDVHNDIFSKDRERYQITLVWEPNNQAIYSFKTLSEFLNEQVFQYPLETHFNVLQQLANNRTRTDVVFRFSDASNISAHSFMLLAYASPKLVDDAKRSHFKYRPEIYEMIVNFIYTGKIPVLKDNRIIVILKEASQYYEIQPLLKWSSLELQNHIKGSLDPEKDFVGYFQFACEYKQYDALMTCLKMAEKSPARLKELLSKLTLENYDYVSEQVGIDTPVTMKGILSQRRHLVSSETSAKTNDVSAEAQGPMCKPANKEQVGTVM